MKKAELTAALEIARSDRSLADVDHTPLFGLYTPQFVAPVTTTILVVAKMVRELCVQFNGNVDGEALAEFGSVARRKIMVVG